MKYLTNSNIFLFYFTLFINIIIIIKIPNQSYAIILL